MAARIPDNGCALANSERERFQQLYLMAALRQAGTDVSGYGLLHVHIAAFEGLLSETRLLERGLHVHAEVNNVRYKLSVGLRLVPAAHNAKANVEIAFLHEGRNDGVERALVPGERVGKAGLELETSATVLERETEAGCDKAGSITAIVALDERDNVSILIDGGEIDGRIAMFIQLRLDVGGHNLTGSVLHIDELRALGTEIF